MITKDPTFLIQSVGDIKSADLLTATNRTIWGVTLTVGETLTGSYQDEHTAIPAEHIEALSELREAGFHIGALSVAKTTQQQARDEHLIAQLQGTVEPELVLRLGQQPDKSSMSDMLSLATRIAAISPKNMAHVSNRLVDIRSAKLANYGASILVSPSEEGTGVRTMLRAMFGRHSETIARSQWGIPLYGEGFPKTLERPQAFSAMGRVSVSTNATLHA